MPTSGESQSVLEVSTAFAKRGIPFPANWSFWRVDTRALVGGVLLAVCFSINMQITERIDTATTGGIWPYLGIVFQCVWLSAATFFFGLAAGLLTAWINPVIAMLTATGPLAPAWFGTNGSFVVAFAVIQHNILRRFKEVAFWPFFWTVWVSNIGTGLVVALVHIFLLRFPWWMVLAFLIGSLIMTIPGAVMAYHFCHYISRSGITGYTDDY